MPEDVDPKERVDSLLAERGALRPDAKARLAAIDEALADLGYKGPLAGDEETADPPKRRGRPPASG